MMNCGVPTFGRPSLGAWLNYGLGSESENLPGYVVLNAGRGTSGGASNWSSGFLPTHYQGVLFRNSGEPVLNLNNPPGFERRHATEADRRGADGSEQSASHEQDSRPRNSQPWSPPMSWPFRMQSAAPELIDLSGETKRNAWSFTAIDRTDPEKGGRGGVGAGGGSGVYPPIRDELPARPPHDRARRAVRELVSCIMGSS